MNHLLCYRAMLALRAFLKPLVQSIREVLDVERRHDSSINASILEESQGGRDARGPRNLRSFALPRHRRGYGVEPDQQDDSCDAAGGPQGLRTVNLIHPGT